MGTKCIVINCDNPTQGGPKGAPPPSTRIFRQKNFFPCFGDSTLFMIAYTRLRKLYTRFWKKDPDSGKKFPANPNPNLTCQKISGIGKNLWRHIAFNSTNWSWFWRKGGHTVERRAEPDVHWGVGREVPVRAARTAAAGVRCARTLLEERAAECPRNELGTCWEKRPTVTDMKSLKPFIAEKNMYKECISLRKQWTDNGVIFSFRLFPWPVVCVRFQWQQWTALGSLGSASAWTAASCRWEWA